MKYDLVIFDLDGTLLNTLADLTASANHALAEAGFPARTEEEVRRFIGNGVARLIQRAVPEGTPQAAREAVLAGFRAYYAAHVNVHTRPYPGIIELLEALKAANIHVAVNSNKPDPAVQALCEAHFSGLIDQALGECGAIPKKPAPDGALRLMKATNVPPERTLYVGDGDADLLTAQNAKIDCAWVSWGYRRAEELQNIAIPHRFDSASALSSFILS